MTAQPLPRAAPATVLACGAHLKNRACLLDGDRVHWSASHGDLGEASACIALADSIDELLARATSPLQAVAHDLHPGFHSTRLAQALAHRLGIPAVAVQHHHAHIAVVRAEHGVDAPVIGIALDGVGLGSDGSAWGGELLWVGEGTAWRRIDHLAPLALPGGDVAAREPWRLAAAVLHAAGCGDEIVPRFAPRVGEPAARLLQAMLQRGLNCPRSSAAGRWFDAAAAALGLSTHQAAEAEAALALERAAAAWLGAHPGFEFCWPSLNLQPLLMQLMALPSDDADAVARGAAMFHLGLADALAQRATAAAAETGVHAAVLAGGCFANRILRERLEQALVRAGLHVLQPQRAGCGDAGLALGQAWVAAVPCAAVPVVMAQQPRA